MDWKAEAKQLRFENNTSWTLLAETIQAKYFSNEKINKVLEMVRGYIRTTEEYKVDKVVINNRPTGVFGDTHIPFQHPNFIYFLIDTFKKYLVDIKQKRVQNLHTMS